MECKLSNEVSTEGHPMGQQMKNAPVYFTVAQVRFNPVLSLSTFIPVIQDSFRKRRYPDFKKAVTLMFNYLALPAVAESEGPWNATFSLIRTTRRISSWIRVRFLSKQRSMRHSRSSRLSF